MSTHSYCPICASSLETSFVGERDRLACASDSCNYVHWDNPKPVVAAVIEYQDQIVLVRNVGWPEKWFGLVSGFLERKETPERAILREIKEETNLDGEIIEFLGHYTFDQMNEIIVAYYVRGQGEIVLNEELENYKLVDPKKLRPWPFGTGKAVRDWINRHVRSDETA